MQARVFRSDSSGGCDQRTVARRLGVTRQGVQLIEQRALRKVRRAMGLCESCGGPEPERGRACERCVRENR